MAILWLGAVSAFASVAEAKVNAVVIRDKGAPRTARRFPCPTPPQAAGLPPSAACSPGGVHAAPVGFGGDRLCAVESPGARPLATGTGGFTVEDPVVPPEAPARPGVLVLNPAQGRYRISIDFAETPDLADWASKKLAPVVEAWYPKIVDLLPGEGFEAPRELDITFRADMRGVAATGGTHVSCAAKWFRDNLEGEAKGAVVHELVHVVQQYGGGRRRDGVVGRRQRLPGWLTEGIPDYIRWYLYEPESRGAEISRGALPRARHDAGYRVSANFLHWAVARHGEALIEKLNTALRAGEYTDALWKELTDRDLEELDKAWKEHLEEELEKAAEEKPVERGPVEKGPAEASPEHRSKK